MIRCEHCGALQADGSKFCTECGARLPSPPPITREPAYPQSTPQQYAAPQPNPYAQQNIYAQPVPAAPQPPVYPQRQTYAPPGPVGQLKTNRGLLKLILLSIITFGIYGLVVMSAVSTDINTIASRYDGKKTMHYCLVVFIFSWLTFGIVPLVWSHRISARIGNELTRRGINYSFGAGTFWGWGVLGSLILVGPFVYTHKLLKSMNLLSEHYNSYG